MSQKNAKMFRQQVALARAKGITVSVKQLKDLWKKMSHRERGKYRDTLYRRVVQT